MQFRFVRKTFIHKTQKKKEEQECSNRKRNALNETHMCAGQMFQVKLNNGDLGGNDDLLFQRLVNDVFLRQANLFFFLLAVDLLPAKQFSQASKAAASLQEFVGK